MISVNKLAKSYPKKGSKKERVTAVSDVSFQAKKGQITALLGPNGAGKSTTLRMLAGLVEPESGSGEIDGWDIRKNKLQIRQSIGYLPHNSGLYPRFTARENIEYFADLAGMEKSEIANRIDELIEMLNMQDFINRRTEGFSQGQKTKVALARALVHRPGTLMLDEPTNGLDVMATRKLRKILSELKEAGHCVLISSHIMQEVSILCDHVAIISQGRIVMEDSVADILAKTGQMDLEEAFVVAVGESLGEV